jgi:hypothetical protein
MSSPLARARPGGGWLRELGLRLPGPEPPKTRHARPAVMALRRALPRVPLGHFSAWPPKAGAPLPPGCRGAQSPRIRRRATQAVHHVSERGATACPNAGAVINARAARAAILALCKSRLFASILVLVSGRVMQNMRCISKGATNFKSLASTSSATSAPLFLIGFSPRGNECFPIEPLRFPFSDRPCGPCPCPGTG